MNIESAGLSVGLHPGDIPCRKANSTHTWLHVRKGGGIGGARGAIAPPLFFRFLKKYLY